MNRIKDILLVSLEFNPNNSHVTDIRKILFELKLKYISFTKIDTYSIKVHFTSFMNKEINIC